MIRDSIELVSKNNNGVFQTHKNKKGKDVDTLIWENCHLYHYGIGALISDDVSPKFQGWTYDDYVKEFEYSKFVRFLEPMSAHEDTEYINRDEMKEDEIAELKYDGHRGLLFIGDNFNRAFSRRVSKHTGWFTENSDQIPHIRDLILPDFSGTVIDGEFDYGTTSMGVQSVMGAKPENAIQYQFKNGFIQYRVFDILYYKGINVQNMPLWKRKIYLYKVINAFQRKYANCNIEFAKVYLHPEAYTYFTNKLVGYGISEIDFDGIMEHTSICGSYAEKFVEKIAEGLEGLMVKDVNAVYEQKRSKSFIKLKGMETWDCFIIGLTPPTKEYDGKDIVNWKFWEIQGELVQTNGQATAVEWANNCGEIPIAVTKPYFMGWCGAIEFGVSRIKTWKEWEAECGGSTYGEIAFDQMTDEGLILNADDDTIQYIEHVGDCKGLSDSLLEDLKNNGEKFIRERRVLEVLANGIINKETGTLRHPRFSKWRDDKDWKQCTFKDHIREVD